MHLWVDANISKSQSIVERGVILDAKGRIKFSGGVNYGYQNVPLTQNIVQAFSQEQYLA